MIYKFSLTITRRQILDPSKLKEFADDNSKFDENGKKLSNQVENTVGKGEMAHYKQFLLFNSVFKRLVLQTCKNQGLLEKVLTNLRVFHSGCICIPHTKN